MIGLSYLAAIILSFIGMLVVDRNYRLAFFYDSRRTCITLMTIVAIFILWDMAGIVLGIFFSGHSRYMSGLYIAPDFPVEELFFLSFLAYFTLILYRLLEKQWARI